MPNVYKGSTATRETTESGVYTNGDKNTRTVVKEGLYDTLLADLPSRGDTYETGWVIDSATLTRKNGGIGRLVLQLRVKSSSSSSTTLPTKVTYEVTMAQLEKDLATRLDGGTGASPDNFRSWQSESNAELKKNLQFMNASGSAVTLTSMEAEMAKLAQRGVTGYLTFSPVAKRTEIYSQTIAVGASCGKRESPPSAALALVSGTWDWLCTADSIVENSDGTYTRTTEWTGADQWDTNLYESA